MTTENWQPTSRYVAKEPSVWERIRDAYGAEFASVDADILASGRKVQRLANGEPVFRAPNEGEWWWSDLRKPLLLEPGAWWPPDTDRLILEPIPAPTPKRYVIVLEETGITDCPRNGQPFIGFGGLPQYAIGDWKDEKRPLLRVVSREAK